MKAPRIALAWGTAWLLWSAVSFAGLAIDRLVFRKNLAEWLLLAIARWIVSNGLDLRAFELASAVALGVADGAILGVFQWLAARRWFPRAAHWIWVTALAWAWGLATFWLMVDLFPQLQTSQLARDATSFQIGIVDSLVSGVVVGGVQWLLLRRWAKGAAWWVPLSVLGAVGAWMVRWFVRADLALAVSGMITGVAMASVASRSVMKRPHPIPANEVVQARTSG